MCGIVGLFDNENIAEKLLQSLKIMEYRGYDSVGIALIGDAENIQVKKSLGRVEELAQQVTTLKGRIGIGHTRWATHGKPNLANAHPIANNNIAVIHNGIIENYHDIRMKLNVREWQTETDTESLLHFLEQDLKNTNHDVMMAVLNMAKMIEGRSAILMLFASDPDAIYAIRKGCPLVIGKSSDGEFAIGSDPLTFHEQCTNVGELPNNSIARLTKNAISILNLEGESLSCEFVPIQYELRSDDLNGHQHFMHKEIYEQANVLKNILRLYLTDELTDLEDTVGVSGLNLGKVNHIHLVGCGTAYHAGLLAKKYLELNTRLPITAETSSEFRDSCQVLSIKTLVIAISQSGETADTLSCVEKAVMLRCQVLAICNNKISTLSRIATKTIHLQCGPEISVAATKSFTAMVLCLFLFSLSCGRNRGLLSKEQLKRKLNDAIKLPKCIDDILSLEPILADIARKYAACQSVFFLGRHWNFPAALEGALKLKEISYIHAEGFAGGELKHGPLALIDAATPVFAAIPHDTQYPKMVSNLREVSARGGRIIGFGEKEDETLMNWCEEYVSLPVVSEELNPIIFCVAWQLIAYHTAVELGAHIDRPRNLAKSVTVE